MLLYAKDKGSSVVRQMDSAEETDPRVFGNNVVSFTGNVSKPRFFQPRFFQTNREIRDSDDQFFELCNEADEKNMRMESKEQTRVLDDKCFLSELDDYVASEKMGSGVSRALRYGFEMGDMVWGKVKSHPWWPGQIYNEAFVSPSVRRMRKMGYVLVAFFGDNTYGWFDPAQLIPFEPHVAKKSQQTNSSHFAKAMEEALDELGRRSALGLTCKCRKPCNFRPTNVQGYFAVHVPDYELQALYSSKQITKARDSFSSVQTLSFVKRCALAPQDCDLESIKSFQKKAAVCAFRRAVFEESDETYEQAFGARSVYTSVKTQEPLNREPTRAPLSGSLVIAETPGNLKSSKSAMEVTKGKYLPKKREEAGDTTVQFGQVQKSSHLQGINELSATDLVLQRRTPLLQTRMKHSKRSHDDDKSLAQQSKGRMGEKAALFSDHEIFEAMTSLKQDETGAHSRSSNEGSLQPFTVGNCSTGAGIKKSNVLKRSSGKMNDENGPQELKKKKKKKREFGSELNCDSPDNRKALTFGEVWIKKSSHLDAAKRNSDLLIVRNSKLDVMQLLSNLQALSLDPFFGSSDKSSIKALRQFFLRFRSLVYLKSLPTSPSSTKLSKSAKTLCRNNELSKAWSKRPSSDKQQDVPSTKKLKKTFQFKPIASDKKTNQEAKKRSNLAPFSPVRDQGVPIPINAKQAIAQSEKKTAPSAKVAEPTMLVMKFPRGTSLPSATLLKAMFGRFGLLDQSAIKVFWKSSICRVVFRYKLDAQTALRYASGSNSLFGNVNVRYSIRDVKASSASGDHELKKGKTDEPIVEPLSQRLKRAPLVHQPSIQLKSCLKKTGNDGKGNRITARVKLMLGGKETETPFPVSGRNNGNYHYASSSSSSVAMEFASKNTQNMVPSTLSPILPLSSRYSKPKPVNNQVNHDEPPLNTVDISQQMMKLLTRCIDVVANVTGLLGYVPYHRL